MKIYIDTGYQELAQKFKLQYQSLKELQTRPFSISIEKLVASDLNNIYAKLIDDSHIVFYLRSTQQIAFICKEISQDFGSFGTTLRVSLNELLMNALEHGNFEIDKNTKNNMISEGNYYELLENLVEKDENKFIELKYELSHPKTITITDQGKGFEFQHYLDQKDISETQYCGRGIYIASTQLPKNNAEIKYLENGHKLVINFQEDKHS